MTNDEGLPGPHLVDLHIKRMALRAKLAAEHEQARQDRWDRKDKVRARHRAAPKHPASRAKRDRAAELRGIQRQAWADSDQRNQWACEDRAWASEVRLMASARKRRIAGAFV